MACSPAMKPSRAGDPFDVVASSVAHIIPSPYFRAVAKDSPDKFFS